MRFVLVLFGLVFVSVLFTLSCSDDNDVAPGDGHLFLTAEPQQITFNGTSTLTVSGTDGNGAPLPDGTQVSFSVVQAGRISPSSVQLVNGSATTKYFATNFTGEITVTAMSGSVEASTSITVSDDIERKVFVSAIPATFPSGGGTSIVSAVVTDNSGIPVVDIGVQFTTTAGTLQSGGDFIQTNDNGVASDTLNTSASATVTATTDDGFSGETTINVGIGRIVCHMSVNNSNPNVGQTILFFDISDDPGNQIARYHWDFGDTLSADGKNVQHSYNAEGTFDVIHSVTDNQGNTYFCDPFPIEVSP